MPLPDGHSPPPDRIPPVVDHELAARRHDLATTDLPCLNCGYNLRGLTEDGRCPECGTPVERSLHGNLLIYSAADYLRTMHLGLVVIIASVIASVAVSIVFIALTILFGAFAASQNAPASAATAVTMTEVAATLFASAIGLVTLVGWWMFSAPDPAIIGQETGSRARVIVRTTVAISAAATILQAVFETASASTVNPAVHVAVVGTTAASLIAGIVKFFAAMLYIRWLAPRLPSRAIDKKARQYMWLIPLLVLVTPCTIYISLLVALVLYLLLLNELRQGIRSIREVRAREDAYAGPAA